MWKLLNKTFWSGMFWPTAPGASVPVDGEGQTIALTASLRSFSLESSTRSHGLTASVRTFSLTASTE